MADAMSLERTVRQFVEEVNHLVGEGHLLRAAEQQALLDELGLETLGVALGLEGPPDSD
jgi:hypothetical protein